MNFSRVTGLRRNQRIQLLSNAAVPQNRIIRGSSSSDLSEEEYQIGSGSSLDSSLDSLASDDSCNSFSSNTPPTTPKSSDESPKITLLEEKPQFEEKGSQGKLGIPSLLANSNEANLSESKNIMLSHQLKVDNRPLDGASSPSVKPKKIPENNNDDVLLLPPAPKKPLDNSPSSNKHSSTLGLVEFGSRQISNGGGHGLRLCHDCPCIFAPRWDPSGPPPYPLSYNDLFLNPESMADAEVRGHAIISPQGYPCFRPLTFCRVHKCAGVLRLQDIQDSEFYSRVNVSFPYAKVTHRFNYCILQFPPPQSKLIAFKPRPVEDSPLRPPRLKLTPQPQVKFLRFCLECYKPLSKRDVYVYRGEAWFCSANCRYWNIKEAKEEEMMALARYRARIEKANGEKAVAECSKKSNETESEASSGKGKGKGILYIG